MKDSGKRNSKNSGVRAFLLDVDHLLENGKPVLRLWCKLPSGKNLVAYYRKYEPYFYVEPRNHSKADMEELTDRIRSLEAEGRRPTKVELTEKRYLGLPLKVLRIYAGNPTDIPKLRDLLKEWKDVKDEYEYGITYYRKFLIDRRLFPMDWIEIHGNPMTPEVLADEAMDASDIKPLSGNGTPHPAPPLRVLAFDLEMAEEKGEERIIMASFRDNSGLSRALTYKKVSHPHVEVVPDEKALLERFMEIVRERNPDIIAGYNSDRYDFLRLAERAESHKVHFHLGRDRKHLVFKKRMRVSSAQLTGRVHVDLYDFVDNILGSSLMTEVLSLDKVAKEILGEGKLKMR
ncbi:MAG TPA: 3'-5' exonuclease, partial [archaeon]|nr:3'-5' exonuclease [archaeon]